MSRRGGEQRGRARLRRLVEHQDRPARRRGAGADHAGARLEPRREPHQIVVGEPGDAEAHAPLDRVGDRPPCPPLGLGLREREDAVAQRAEERALAARRVAVADLDERRGPRGACARRPRRGRRARRGSPPWPAPRRAQPRMRRRSAPMRWTSSEDVIAAGPRRPRRRRSRPRRRRRAALGTADGFDPPRASISRRWSCEKMLYDQYSRLSQRGRRASPLATNEYAASAAMPAGHEGAQVGPLAGQLVDDVVQLARRCRWRRAPARGRGAGRPRACPGPRRRRCAGGSPPGRRGPARTRRAGSPSSGCATTAAMPGSASSAHAREVGRVPLAGRRPRARGAAPGGGGSARVPHGRVGEAPVGRLRRTGIRSAVPHAREGTAVGAPTRSCGALRRGRPRGA